MRSEENTIATQTAVHMSGGHLPCLPPALPIVALQGHAGVQVQEALRHNNVQGVHPGLLAYLNQAVWLHMEGLLAQACKMATQRADLSRSVLTLSFPAG